MELRMMTVEEKNQIMDKANSIIAHLEQDFNAYEFQNEFEHAYAHSQLTDLGLDIMLAYRMDEMAYNLIQTLNAYADKALGKRA